MLVKNVHIYNVTCFEDLYLSFENPNGISNWVAIVGENGTGKSTILKMIALALMGQFISLDVIDRVYLSRFFRNRGTRPASAEITLSASRRDKNKIRGINDYIIAMDLHRVSSSRTLKQNTGIMLIDANSSEILNRLNKSLYSEDRNVGWFACAYGPWRRLPTVQQSTRFDVQQSFPDIKGSRFVTLFHDNFSLSSFSEWLIDLEFRRLKEKGGDADRDFQFAVQTIEHVLGGIKFHEITADKDIIFSDSNSLISLEQMSDGYRSVTAWVGDLVRQLVLAYPQSSNPLLEEGVVIIDEIDIHLHPAWQKNIVEQTKQVFPNIQFIISSHSPFVIQDFTADDTIIVLEKEDDKVLARKWDTNINGWRVDQILTSGLFKLQSTRNNTIEEMERRRIDLLTKKVRNEITDLESDELSEIQAYLDRVVSDPVFEDDDPDEDIDSFISGLSSNNDGELSDSSQ